MARVRSPKRQATTVGLAKLEEQLRRVASQELLGYPGSPRRDDRESMARGNTNGGR
jgi:hypothetical protein